MMTCSMSVIWEQPVKADLTRLETPQPCRPKGPSSASAAAEPSLRSSRRERFRIVLILDAVYGDEAEGDDQMRFSDTLTCDHDQEPLASKPIRRRNLRCARRCTDSEPAAKERACHLRGGAADDAGAAGELPSAVAGATVGNQRCRPGG